MGKSTRMKTRDVGPTPTSATRFKKFEIRWAEPLGRPECPFVIRYVLTLFGYSIRLHYWLGSDDQRFFHDHAWDFISILLRGSYLEITPNRSYLRKSGSIRLYRAQHKHKVLVVTKPCWTLVLSKPHQRNFGYWVNNHLMRPLRYFSRYGIHPCE